jgi:hypothetical protein
MYKADTPNKSLHSNIPYTQRQTELVLAATPATVPEYLEASVAALIYIPVADFRASSAPMKIKNPVPVAMGLTPINLANNGTNQEAMIAIAGAYNTCGYVIEIIIMMNCNTHIKQPAY